MGTLVASTKVELETEGSSKRGSTISSWMLLNDISAADIVS
jgi:hypothetical protein